MKQSIALLFCVLFCVNAYAQQPHNLQLDDGLGHYSLLEGSTTGGIYILPPGGGTLLTAPQPGTASLAWLTHGNLLLDSDWTNNILGNLDNNSLRIVTNAQTRFLIAADGSTSINDSAYAQTSIGNGSSNPQLVIRGNADALSGDGYPGPEWDLDVQGDAAIAGIARFGLTGNSIWIDGSGFVNTIQSDHDLTVESASALTLNSGGESPLYINDANGWNTYINSTVGATTTIGVNGNGSTIDLEAPTISAPNIPSSASATNVVLLDGSGNLNKSSLSFITGSGTVNTIPKWTPSTNTLGDSKLTDDGTTLSYNSGSFTANSSAITMTSDNAGASVGDAGQIVVRGSTNNNQQLMLGYNTTGDYATIMSILQGTGGRGIYINPAGGAVGVDYAGGTALSANFNVNGTVNISSLPASASSTVVTTNGGTLESRPISEIAVTGTGTQNFITKWNNAGGTTIGNSLLSDDGTTVTSGATIIPGTTNTFDLGSSTNRWKAVFLAGALNHSLNGDNPLDNSGVSGHGLASHALNYQVSSDGYVATFSNTSAVTSDGVQIAVNTSDGSSRALTITNGSNFNPTGGVGNRNEAFYVKDNGTTFIGTLPASASSTVVTSNGGTLESRSIGEIAVTGTGTQDFITKWNNAGGTTIGNSLLSDNGTTLDYNTGKFTVASATGNTSTAGSMTVGNLTANGVVHATGGTGLLASSLIVNADVDPAAAIAYSKLNLASSIVNGDLAGGVYGAITGLGAQTQALNMGTHQINGVVDPTLSTDAATKGYVDTKVNGAVSGTINTIAKFTSANAVGNSLLTDNGNTLAYNTSAFTMSSAGQGGQTYTIGGNAGPYVAHTITATNNNGGSIGNTDITGLRVTSNEGAGGDDIALGASFVADGGLTGLATAASFTAQNGVTNTAIDVTSGFVHITPLTASSVVRTDGSSNLTTGLIVNGDLTNTTYSNIAGIGSQSQALNMNTHQINGVVDPTSAQDAATKNYVDTKVNGAVSGTINTMAKFTSANVVGNSAATDNGTTLSYSGTHINSGTDYQIGGSTVLHNGGTSNMFAGVFAGSAISTGSNNAAFGHQALNNNSTGNQNTAVGASALQFATSSQNTAVGMNSLLSLGGGGQNTAVGYQAGSKLAGGGQNLALGHSALLNAVAANNNIAVGYHALDNTLADANTALGSSAGTTNTTGTNNTFVGNGADAGAVALTNATAIGNGAVVAASNTMQLGNGSVTLVNTSGAINTGTGYQVGGSAASGTVLMGSGTNYVASTTTFPNAATTGDLLYASAANTYGNLADVATGSVLLSGGVGTAPSYGQVTNAVVASGTFSNITGLGAQSQALNMNSKQINGLADPTVSTDAATMGYVDNAIGTAWKLTGNSGLTDNTDNKLGTTDDVQLRVITNGTTQMVVDNSTNPHTLDLVSNGTLQNVQHIANTGGTTINLDDNVDVNTHDMSNLGNVTINTGGGAKIASVTGTAGVSINDFVEMNNHKIVSVVDPTSAQDAATKNYVDNSITTGVNAAVNGTTGQLAVFSGTHAVGNGNLSGDVTTSGTTATTIANNVVTYGKMQAVSTTSKLLGSSSTTTPVQEITLGTGLSMSGTTLNATSALSGLTTNGAVYADGASSVTSTAAMTNGQLLIGSTGVAPVLGTIGGTASRLAVTNGAGTITLDIDANYVGQNTITTLGTIGTGTWNGTAIGSQYGGTGLNTSATLMGAMLYTSATGTWNTLSGPTAGSTKYFLTSTPSAGTAQPPSWVLLAASDIPDLSSTYIKNQTSLQASSNFNISGNGTIGSSLIVPTVTGGDGGVPVAITVHGGDGASTAGASTTLRGGDATGSFTGGAVSIRGGQSSTSGAGGAITISGGSSGPTGGAAGTLTLAGGSATGALTGGAAMLRGGTGGVTSGTGGQLTLAGGASGSAAGTGGNVVIQTASTGTGTTLTDRLTVDASGNAIVNTAGATLSVGEASGFGSNVSVNMKDGHLRSRITTAPTAVVTTGGGTVALANATDVAGYVTYTEGATPAAGDKVTVTFNKAYNAAPIVVISANDANAATSQAYVTSTATTFTVTLNAPIASVAHGFSYHVIETQ